MKLELNCALPVRAIVRASSDWLRRAFDVLVDNAVDAVKDLSTKAISIATRSSEGYVEIVICDTGGGIPEDVMKKLFTGPIRKSLSSKGLGIGLLMAQAIVEAYGGSLLVERTSLDGTTMVIRLPLEIQDAARINPMRGV